MASSPEHNNPASIDISQIKVGDYLSETQYYRVVKVNPKTVILLNQKGVECQVDKNLLIEMYSAGQYQTEKKINRGEINSVLEKVGQHIFTINFCKQVKDSNIKEQLLDAIKDKDGNPLSYDEIEKNLKKISKQLHTGQERTLIGYLVEYNNQLGRSRVIDLEIEVNKNRLRQIDHRTINWLIFRNTKYIVT